MKETQLQSSSVRNSVSKSPIDNLIHHLISSKYYIHYKNMFFHPQMVLSQTRNGAEAKLLKWYTLKTLILSLKCYHHSLRIHLHGNLHSFQELLFLSEHNWPLSQSYESEINMQNSLALFQMQYSY